MKEELTKEMHSEFTINSDAENRIYASSFWYYSDSYTDEEVMAHCKKTGHDFSEVVKYKDHWIEARERSKKCGTF